MELNSTTPEEFEGSGFFMNGTTFSCLNTSALSGTMVTNQSFWQILESLHNGTPYVATVVFIFFVISFLWNLFIIVTYFVKFRLLKEPANIFLLSLAFYDVVSSVIMTLFSFIIVVRREYIFGTDDFTRCGTCDMVGFFFVFLVEGSIHLLMFLSIDRFILLSRPLRYKKIMKRWVAVVIVICITIFAFFLAIMPIAFGFGQYEFNIRFGICLARFGGESRAGINNLYYFTFLIIEGLIPIIVLSVTNVFTYRLVHKFLRRNFRRRSTYRRKEETTDDARKYQKQQRQLVRVFGALFIANAISWTPVIITTLVVNFVDAELVPDELYVFGWICYLTNSLFHPILESFFVQDLRLVVNRAKKKVGRASTLIWRQSSKFFSASTDSALRKANEMMDRQETSTSLGNTSLVTESFVEESTATVPNGTGEILSSPSHKVEEEKAFAGERPQSLRKIGRSVTFSEEVNGPAIPSPTNGVQPKPNSVLKKKNGVNKRSPPPVESIIEEDEAVFGTSKSEGSEDVVSSSPSAESEEVQSPGDSSEVALVTAPVENRIAENGTVTTSSELEPSECTTAV